jgi:hypothetical protein
MFDDQRSKSCLAVSDLLSFSECCVDSFVLVQDYKAYRQCSAYS